MKKTALEAQNTVSIADLEHLAQVVGPPHVHTDVDKLTLAGTDYLRQHVHVPAAIVAPGTAAETAAILGWCNQKKIPVTAQGANTSLSASALPARGGIVLSTSRLTKLEIDTKNGQARVGPGVVTQTLAEEAAKHGLFYAPDPASRGSCTVGGNIAHASGGPRAVKYGTTRDFVLNLQVALASGACIWTGADTLKYSTGYNLTQLMVGSEGTLGIVTEAILKLVPLPKYRLLLLASFADAGQACATVSKMMQGGIWPSALELMERTAVEFAARFAGKTAHLPTGTEAQLIVELDGNHLEAVYAEAMQAGELLEAEGAIDVLMAEGHEDQERIWLLRRKIGEAVKAGQGYIEEDTAVPRAALPEMLAHVKEVCGKAGLKTVCYGHAGDGNLHVNILKDGSSPEVWESSTREAIESIFRKCKALGGTLSGEHGVGHTQKEFMPLVLDSTNLHLMRKIKEVFDPHGILNPGKIFPS